MRSLLGVVGSWALPCVLGLLPLGAPAQVQAQAEPALPQAEAKAWLARIQAAAQQGNYQGTLIYSTSGSIATSRVWHYRVGADTFERLEAQDGRQQRIVRHNEAVHTLWPQTQVVVVEKRETVAGWSTTPQAVDPQALEAYVLRAEGSGRVAGREAAVMLLQPRDALRYAQRLWADLASGLMLRADVMNPASPRTLLESTAFTEVEVGVKPQPDLVLKLLRGLDGWRQLRPQQRLTTPEAEGWLLARPVPGFRFAGAMRRGMEASGDGEPVLQAVFTDGLAHVSVFIEPYKPQRHRQEVQAQQGATGTVMQRRDEHWVTVVGDVPAATLMQFAAAFERRKP
jgi:sigma-E factor negative regulatory protein RseB